MLACWFYNQLEVPSAQLIANQALICHLCPFILREKSLLAISSVCLVVKVEMLNPDAPGEFGLKDVFIKIKSHL